MKTTISGDPFCHSLLRGMLLSERVGLGKRLEALCVQSYPLDLVRTRLTAQVTDHYYQGILGTMRMVVRDEGIRGLYRGLGATLAQVTPALAVNYAAYESLRAQYMSAHPEQQTPSVGLQFRL